MLPMSGEIDWLSSPAPPDGGTLTWSGSKRSVGPWNRPARRFVRYAKTTKLCALRPFGRRFLKRAMKRYGPPASVVTDKV